MPSPSPRATTCASRRTTRSGVERGGQHNWVLGNNGLNQITGQVNHLYRLSDIVSSVTGEHYQRDFPNVASSRRAWRSPRSTPARAGRAASKTDTYVIQLKDDVSLLKGNHGLKFGANYNNLLAPRPQERERALPDADVLRRSVSHPEQQQRPLSPGLPDAGYRAAVAAGQHGALRRRRHHRTRSSSATWFQDDWRATSRLTLNLGVRYDIDFNFYDQRELREQRDAAGARGHR